MLDLLIWNTRPICDGTVLCCAVVNFFVLIIRFTNSVEPALYWHLSLGCQLSGNGSQVKWTERSRFVRCSFFWARCVRFKVNCVFNSTHHHLLVYLCSARRPPRCYVPSLLIGSCWSKLDRKSINCVPLASLLVDIKKNVFWAQS